MILKRLTERQKLYSMTRLAKESKLHRNTVEKCIELFLNLEKLGLEDYRIKRESVDNKKIIFLERRTGLLSFPEDIQNLIIKLRYYPVPSEEGTILVHLFINNAISPTNALKLGNNEKFNKLIDQGQIKRSRNGIYLSDEGIIVAKGILKIFPDLEKIKN
jgi:hypothetical protein